MTGSGTVEDSHILGSKHVEEHVHNLPAEREETQHNLLLAPQAQVRLVELGSRILDNSQAWLALLDDINGNLA